MSGEATSPATASSHSGSIFDDDWKSFGGNDPNEFENLDDINLDDLLRPSATNDSIKYETNGTIDPQVLQSTISPARSTDAAQRPHDGDEGDNIVVGPAAKGEESGQPFAVSLSHFHHSMEGSAQRPLESPITYSSPMFSQRHRRSVSEPPTSVPSSYVHDTQIPMIPEEVGVTFTRAGVSLGTPKLHHGNRATLSSKSKHPYIQEPYPVAKPWDQERYHLRRANAQPFRHAPTSVPAAQMMHHMHAISSPPMMTVRQTPSRMKVIPTQPSAPMVTSRVCTPAPSPPGQSVGSPAPIDAALMNTPGPWERKKMVTIPLAVEELRGMITEAVKAALSNFRVRSQLEDEEVEDAHAGVEGDQG